jgi:hypothetical protein
MSYGQAHPSNLVGKKVPKSCGRYFPYGGWRVMPTAGFTDQGYTGQRITIIWVLSSCRCATTCQNLYPHIHTSANLYWAFRTARPGKWNRAAVASGELPCERFARATGRATGLRCL